MGCLDWPTFAFLSKIFTRTIYYLDSIYRLRYIRRMDKRTSTATFSDGSTISRKTAKNYTHAFGVFFSQPHHLTGVIENDRVAGFASSADMARKAAGNVFGSWASKGLVILRTEVVEVM